MRFNQRTKNKITNFEGAPAYALSPELALYTAVLSSSLNDKFYETADERLTRIRELIKQNKPSFVAKLAIYAREQMHVRTMPLVLTVELAKVHNGDNLVSRLVPRVVQRADEITELLAYYQLANNRNGMKKLHRLSKQIQRGLALTFNKFDEYQFAKYNRQTEVKLKDALFLVHPRATDEAQQVLFNKIVEDRLEIPYTWEVELSSLGQVKFDSEAAKKDAFQAKWEEMIESGRLGYMALLRNLRNILESQVRLGYRKAVAERLGSAYQVAKSKQLPFRFLAAYRELKNYGGNRIDLFTNALERAIQASVANLKGFDQDTKVLIACDVSGSMFQPISARSTIQLYDIGLVLGMLLQSKLKSVETGIFGNTWKRISLSSKNILKNTETLRKMEGKVGYSTNGYLVIQDLRKRREIMDKVMIFTDMQLWNSRNDGASIANEWKQYKKIAPQAKLYLFDLAGYGQAPLNIKENDVYLIAGWSNKIFEVLEALENGQNALSKVEEINL